MSVFPVTCDRCGKPVAEESFELHHRACGGFPETDSPEDVTAHRLFIDEIRTITGPARTPTKAELRRAAVNAIKKALRAKAAQ